MLASYLEAFPGLEPEDVSRLASALRSNGEISDEHFLAMLPYFVVMHHERGERIVDGSRFYGYFLVSGAARRFDTVTDATLELCPAGDILLHYSEPRELADGIEFVSSSRVVAFTHEGRREILTRFPDLHPIDSNLLSRKLVEKDRIQSIRALPARERIECIEREFAPLFGAVPQYLIADLFGVSAEHFSRLRRLAGEAS